MKPEKRVAHGIRDQIQKSYLRADKDSSVTVFDLLLSQPCFLQERPELNAGPSCTCIRVPRYTPCCRRKSTEILKIDITH